MDEVRPGPPSEFGVDHLSRVLQKLVDVTAAGFGCIERLGSKMADQVQDLRDAVDALTNEVSEVAGDIVDALDRLNAKIGNQPDLAGDIQNIRNAIGKLQDGDALLDAAGVDVPAPAPAPAPEPAPARGRK